jgi:hypothetical protein
MRKVITANGGELQVHPIDTFVEFNYKDHKFASTLQSAIQFRTMPYFRLWCYYYGVSFEYTLSGPHLTFKKVKPQYFLHNIEIEKADFLTPYKKFFGPLELVAHCGQLDFLLS